MSTYVIDEPDGTRRFVCPICGGPSHPASGCVYSVGFVVCGPCTRETCTWLERWTQSKGRRNGISFYEHAAKR